MSYLCFHAEKEFLYHWCGKFTSPNNTWIHLTRNLEDYELFVVTEGTLHIASETSEYTVQPGEYLLMPPTKFQHGTTAFTLAKTKKKTTTKYIPVILLLPNRFIIRDSCFFPSKGDLLRRNVLLS